MKKIIAICAGTLFLILGACVANAAANVVRPATMSDQQSVLAPTGTLRAAFLGANPVQGRVDPVSGAVSGPVADLVAELASRLGVPFQIIPAPDARSVIGHLQAQTADIGFLAYEPSRATEVDFAGPYALMLNTYVVAENSASAASADIDRPGSIVGAVRGQAQELYLSQNLRNARVEVFERQPPREELEELLVSGKLSAFGMNRQRALEMDASTKVRALPDSFLGVVQQFVVRKGEAGKRALLTDFAAELRASGFVRASLEKAGLERSASVAAE